MLANNCSKYLIPNDTSTIDELVFALYDVISGGAGERNWDRFQSLFYKDAYMGMVRESEDGKPHLKKISPQDYIKINSHTFSKYDFFEKELFRKVQLFGNMSNVFSTYEYELHLDNHTRRKRGLNSIQLIFEGDRWWILSVVWSEESEKYPIPSEYLP